ncbi:MAG: leucine-rich repeat protein [Bacteroidales bacterium]|nr:leucine-rich repeat protein [Bacteroidales bacterium]
MKKTLLIAACAMAGIAAAAQSFSVDDYAYTVTAPGKVQVTGWSSADVKAQAKPITPPSEVTYEGKTYAVTSIGSYAFKWTNSTVAEIPGSVDSIYDNAFASAKIASLTLNEGLKYIGNNALSSCKFTSFVAPSTLVKIDDNAFFGSSYSPVLASVKLNEGLKYIGKSAFYGTCFTEVEIPASVDTIGKTAFLYNKKLETVTMHDGVKYIGDGAFNNCIALNAITLPSTVKEVGIELFLGATKLTKINVPAALTKIGGSFTSKTSIKDIELDPANPAYKLVDGCLYTIDGSMLVAAPMAGKAEVKVADGCLGIANGAFWGSSISSVTLPESIVAIDDYAFCQSALASINFPDAICFMGEQSFAATNLTSVVLPQNFQYINDGQFAQCTKLTSVVIPSSVKEIYNHAFMACSAATFTCKGSKAPYLVEAYDDYDQPFYNCSGKVYVPKGATASYKAEYWHYALTVVEGENGTVKAVKVTPANGDTVKVAGKQAALSFQVTFDQPVTVANANPNAFLRQGGDMSAAVVRPADKWVVTLVNDTTVQVTGADAEGNATKFTYDASKKYCFTLPEGTVVNANNEENEYVSVTFYYKEGAEQKKGDVNGDGEVNVSDVTALVNKILGTAEYADAVCDVNEDGEVNVSDVTALINIILAQ